MLYSIVGILVVVIDQLVKFWVDDTLFGTDIVRFIPGVISLVKVHNNGAAFGFLAVEGARIWFIVAAAGFALLVILALATNFISGKLARWSLVLVAAGGIGNMIDRVMYGYVTDMFKVELFNFPVFNVADIFITVFSITFVLALLFERPEPDVEELYQDQEEEAPAPKPKKRSRRPAAESETGAEPAPARSDSVRAARKSRQDKYEKEYEQFKARQRAAKRPADAENEGEENPFAAWEQANARAEAGRADSYAGRVMDVEAPKPVKVVSVEAEKPAAEAPKPAPKPAPAPVQEDFNLDDILAEFK